MAKFQYEVPDDQLKQLADDFCLIKEYQPRVEVVVPEEVTNPDGSKETIAVRKTIDNPVTPLQLVLNSVQEYMNDVSRAAKRRRADIAAQEAAAKQEIPPVTITVL